MPGTAAILTNRLFDWYTAELAIGGGERYTLQLADLLKEMGYSVVIYQLTQTIPYTQKFGDYTVHAYRPKTVHPEQELCDEFYRQTGSCNVHIITMPEYATGEIHDGTILTLQGSVWFNCAPDHMTKEKESSFIMALENCPKVVAIHRYIRDAARTIFGRPITVINHGIDTNLFKPSDQQLIPSNSILFPGRAEKVKGSELYKSIYNLHEYSGNREWKMSWVGNGSQFNSLPNAMCVPQDKMPDIYRESNICVIMNCGEFGTSLTLLESMSSGCACIAFNGVQDAIIDDYNGLSIDSKSPEGIYSSIQSLMKFPRLRKTYGERARETITIEYNLQRWKEEWEKEITCKENAKDVYEKGHLPF